MANQMRLLPQQVQPIGGCQSPRWRRQFNAHKHGPVRAVDHAILIIGIIIHPYSLSRLSREKEPVMDQKYINLFDRFTHGGMNRRDFMEKLTMLAGSTTAATALLPLLENNYAHADILPEGDPRIVSQTLDFQAAPVTL